MSTKRWLGQAASVFDTWTVSLSGTVVSQTYTLTINSKTVTYVAGSSDSVAVILAALATNWNASTSPEFMELAAVASSTNIVITQDIAGRPTTITASTSGAATFSISNTTAATGPMFFDNGQNWSGGSAPANSDTLVFDSGNVNCSYNINTSLTGITVNVNQGYSGNIGLPLINASSNQSNTYAEYRTTNLTLAGGTVVINDTLIQQCNLAFGANAFTLRVLAAGQRLTPSIPVVLVTGGTAGAEVDITKGDVGVAFYQGNTATIPLIKTGYLSNALTDVSLIAGLGATLTTVTKNGGNATFRCNVTTITQEVAGGTVTLTDAAAVTTLTAYSGTVNLNSTGTLATLNLYGDATLNCNSDPRAKTITNAINVYGSKCSVIDDQKSINSGTLSLNTNGLQSWGVSHGGNTTASYT